MSSKFLTENCCRTQDRCSLFNHGPSHCYDGSFIHLFTLYGVKLSDLRKCYLDTHSFMNSVWCTIFQYSCSSRSPQVSFFLRIFYQFPPIVSDHPHLILIHYVSWGNFIEPIHWSYHMKYWYSLTFRGRYQTPTFTKLVSCYVPAWTFYHTRCCDTNQRKIYNAWVMRSHSYSILWMTIFSDTIIYFL